METLSDILGLCAGTLTTLAFLPQLIKAWRSKTTKDISLLTFILFTTGVILWCVYGFMIHALPIILSNIITLLIASGIIVLKIIYDRNTGN